MGSPIFSCPNDYYPKASWHFQSIYFTDNAGRAGIGIDKPHSLSHTGKGWEVAQVSTNKWILLVWMV
jgi:hypothetical protein